MSQEIKLFDTKSITLSQKLITKSQKSIIKLQKSILSLGSKSDLCFNKQTKHFFFFFVFSTKFQDGNFLFLVAADLFNLLKD